jgi:hypothetical protein
VDSRQHLYSVNAFALFPTCRVTGSPSRAVGCARWPVIRAAVWVAWARGPDGEHQQGEGDSPEQALADLANKLKPIQGNPNG